MSWGAEKGCTVPWIDHYSHHSPALISIRPWLWWNWTQFSKDFQGWKAPKSYLTMYVLRVWMYMHWMDLYLYNIYIYIYSSIHPDPSCIQLLENLLAAVSLLKFETPLLKIYLSKYKLCLNCSAFGYKSRCFTLVYH